jgi:organic hydroperoxide reductase OsmC/OhrA
VQVSLLKDDAGAFKLAAAIMASFPGLTKDAALDLLRAAHEMCPYSRAVKGNIDVTLALAK